MKRKATDVLADVFIYVFMAVLSLLCLIPFIHVLSVSISGNGAVMSNQVFLIPKDVNLDAYKTVFGDATMMRSLWFTVFVTVAFTALGMFLTICGAFALSRKRLKGRKVIGVIFLITMWEVGSCFVRLMHTLIKDLQVIREQLSVIMSV